MLGPFSVFLDSSCESGFLCEPEKTLGLRMHVPISTQTEKYMQTRASFSTQPKPLWKYLKLPKSDFLDQKPEKFFLHKKMRLDLKRREMQ